ncbi:RibD family protein [uncultured Sphingomonas sp.]|uniref:RibD family protein n=1 Tax=uncultured Sphingomonas sp. TaxID=158754 RepID=UPI0025D18C7F|nr:RibD family protein [uncultured Sphingomonas sp.]
MKPDVVCLMNSSIDGRLHPSRYTESPDGDAKAWGEVYETIHASLNGDAWIVGRVTMAEMSKAGPHAPADPNAVERPVHVAGKADSYAVALDQGGKLHFAGATVGGDHVIVLLGAQVPDSHLAELAADGVSYIVAKGDDIDLAAMLDVLGERFGIRRLLLEGGAGINGSFFAAGLVDEFHVLIAPALDGGTNVQGIVAHDPGLKGKLRLRFVAAEPRDHGTVQLRYKVLPSGV